MAPRKEGVKVVHQGGGIVTQVEAFVTPSIGANAPACTVTSNISAKHVSKGDILPPTVNNQAKKVIPLIKVKNNNCHERCKTNCICCIYKSPIKTDNLLTRLVHYHDTAAAVMLREGFSQGFKLGFKGERYEREALNLKSALKDPEKIVEKITKEIKLGRMAGPFVNKPLQNFSISPVGLVPKAVPGKFRMIHHLSYPEGESINDGIDRDLCKVKYSSFDDAIAIVVRAGKGALMAKADIESAFRLLPIHPDDFNLLGMKVQGLYYVDKALPMGASCSPAFFELFSTFLEWVVKEEANTEWVSHYCDDFILVGFEEGRKSCHQLVSCFERVCSELGVPLAHDKSVGPTTKLVYLGLEIDTIKQAVSIPNEKLIAIVGKVKSALDASSITLKELQSLIGSLTFVCKAIAPGRAFLRRLIDLVIGVKKQWLHIRLSKGAKCDLKMWLVFLQDFNGCAIIPEQFWRDECDLQLFTDASGSVGYGGYFKGMWFQGKWPWGDNDTKKSIAWLEFFPVVVSVALWGDSLKGKRILVRSDNEAVVAIINKQTSRCPDIMRLVRFFVLQCLKLCLCISARHIPGKINDIADSLSRFQMRRFRDLAPDADTSPTQVPQFLWKI